MIGCLGTDVCRRDLTSHDLPVRQPTVSRLSAKPPIDPPHNEIPDRLIAGRSAGQATQLWKPVRFDGPVGAQRQMSGFGSSLRHLENRNPAKERLTNFCTCFILLLMVNEHPTSPQAEPARPEPSEVRTESCTCCGGTREPDPTDFFIGLLKEAARHSIELSNLVVVEARRAVAAAEPVAEASAEAAAPEPAAAPRTAWYPAAALAHSRLTRSLRLGMVLAGKFHVDRLERDKKLAADEAFEVKLRKNRLKGKVERLVGEAIEQAVEKETERLTESEGESESYDESEFDDEDEEDGPDRRDELRDALSERFTDEDVEQDLGRCPTSEIVGRLCGNLRIQPLWERWSTEQWAVEEARRQVPGSPYAAPPAAEPAAAEVPEAKPEPVEAGPEPVEAKPEEPEPPEPEAEEAKPEEPAAPPKRNIDWYRTPEHQRELEEYRARIRAKCGPGS